MADTYLSLVNKLRDRFNEVRLTSTTWPNTVGFDQFSKDAINYAYQDILNAEMEWPFLHHVGTIYTAPGVQFYDVNTADEFTIKSIDWDGFYINSNPIQTAVTAETHTIPATADYILTPTNDTTWISDLGVKYTASGIDFVAVDYDPQTAGQYTIKQGVYYFNAADAGVSVQLSYNTTEASVTNVISAIHLPKMDYDVWRQTRQMMDNNVLAFSELGKPLNVFKSQTQGQVGITPIPDLIYKIKFEYWQSTDDLINMDDNTVLPDRYNQIILDGAQKYCYEFREDPTLAQMADARFKAGIQRMRTELINRPDDIQSGFYWYNHGTSYTMNTF